MVDDNAFVSSQHLYTFMLHSHFCRSSNGAMMKILNASPISAIQVVIVKAENEF